MGTSTPMTQHEPTPDDMADAMRDAHRALTSGEEPSVPKVSTVSTLKRVASPPYHVGEVTIKSASVTGGDPRHGAKMSADHVSRFVARFPYPCPECPAGTATLEYDRHHNIAGSRSLTCACGYEHESETWG